MPTYDYECTKCGATFELFQSIKARAKRQVKPEDKACDCDAPVTRLIGTGAGVIFKGSGFYQTDYRTENYKKGAKAEKEASDTKSKKDGSSKSSDKPKADAKPKSDTTTKKKPDSKKP